MIFLSSLSSDDAKWWLGTSELLLIVSAIVLSLGLGGEWSDSDAWKKRVWYKLAKAAVILGVVGELLGDAGIFEATARLQTLEERSIADANAIASAAKDRAASAEKEAAEANEHAQLLGKQTEELRAKNLALEKHISWRELSSDTITKLRAAIAAVPTSVPRKVVFSYLLGDQDLHILHMKSVDILSEINPAGICPQT
jgi:hypothetical protein